MVRSIAKIKLGGVTRESNFEILRVIAIFGIISMHTFGAFYNSATGSNLVYGLVINSIFNTGVSLFMLISGYFGVNGNFGKIIKIEIEVLFYSVISQLLISTVQCDWSIKAVAKSFLPVISGKYWFITAYMLLLIFSEFLNKAPEKLSKNEFQKLILLMIFVFGVIPTFTKIDIMNDFGKGFANMLLIYYLGRYIRLYLNDDNSVKKYTTIAILSIVIGLGLNCICTYITGWKGITAPFARDSSIVIIVASVAIFMVFKSLRFKSKAINVIAKHVIAAYLLEGAIRTLLNTRVLDINMYGGNTFLPLISFAYVSLVIIICVLIDIVRTWIFDSPEKLFISFVNRAFESVIGRIDNKMREL